MERERIKTSWKTELAHAIRDTGALLVRLGLDPCETWNSDHFPCLVPESYLRRMTPGDPQDPLLLQVLPTKQEDASNPDFQIDPVGDAAARLASGVLQKYSGRALLITTGACAVHCRYCFRQHYPYNDDLHALEDWQPALDAISNDTSLTEVILSGGDPLVLSDRKLGQLIERLAAIPHLKRLRIHSRLPIVLPSRITVDLINQLTQSRLQPVMVVHANHAQEIQLDCADALKLLVQSGIPTLNQAVLLRRINDNIEALTELCESCVNLGVIPYYLHQLDRVQGAAHFEVGIEHGIKLVEQLRQRLPGYAVPRFVQEIPGEPSKTPIADVAALELRAGSS